MQPREKFLQKGIEGLSELELVSAVISSGSGGLSYRRIAKSALKKIKEVSQREDRSFTALLDVKGLGVAKALQIIAGIELGCRLFKAVQSEKVQIFKTQEAVKYLDDIRYRKRECVKVLYLNARFELLSEEIISIGSVNSTAVLPRDIIIPALEQNASLLIMAHNHPSGSPEPSEADLALTRRIKEACSIVGVDLLEHIVVARDGWHSIST